MDKFNIETINEQCGISNNTKIAIIDDIKSAYYDNAPKQMLFEDFIFGIILKGNARIIIDNVEYSLEQGDMFGCKPHNILEKFMLSIDLKVLGFFVNREYTTKLLSNLPIDWTFMMMVNTHEILHANEQEQERIVSYINLLRRKLSSDDTSNKEQSISLLIQSLALDIFDIHEKTTKQHYQTTFSAGENIVQRFVMLLAESNQHGKPYLNVNGYAERLNISPKHFSLVCKNILGKTASEIINDDIMRTANVLLHDNSLSIKQISDRLGFTNQSHFGTFFRRNSGGISPQEMRRRKH